MLREQLPENRISWPAASGYATRPFAGDGTATRKDPASNQVIPPQRSKTRMPARTGLVSGIGYDRIDSPRFSPKKPTWDHWEKRMDLWKLGEAVCLICKCEPEDPISPKHPLRSGHYYKDDTAKSLREIHQIAVASLKSGKLIPDEPSYSDPSYLDVRAQQKQLCEELGISI